MRPRKKRAAPSAPRSGPPAATLSGGLRPGSRRRSEAQAGVAILVPHDSLGAEVRGCTRPTHGIVPPGKTHSPSPAGLSYARGRGCCCHRISNPSNLSANVGFRPEPSRHLIVSPGFISITLSPRIPLVNVLSSAGVPVRAGKVP